MVGSKSTIIDNAKKIVEALIRNNAVAPNNRLSRHDAVAATGLDEETFDVSYGFLRRSMYVEAPISESGMSATPTGISWYEAAIAQRHPTLRQKIGSQPVLSVISIIVMVLLGVGGTYFGVASNQNFWPFASHTPTLVQSPTRAPTFSPTFPPTAVKPGQHPPLFLDTECSTLDQDDPGIALRVEGFSIDKFGNAIATVTIIDARQELSSVKPYHFGSWQLVDNINHEVHGY
ncbi:MAG: hypothetical protein CMJ62_16055 [Planctomycetaceae bacterium]|nr:hypothetical protein [Planctomycetaceae bacterium]